MRDRLALLGLKLRSDQRRQPLCSTTTGSKNWGWMPIRCLPEERGFGTVGDLISRTEAELDAIPNFDNKNIDGCATGLPPRSEA